MQSSSQGMGAGGVSGSAVQHEVRLVMDMDCVGSCRAAARGWAQVACPEAQCSTR